MPDKFHHVDSFELLGATPAFAAKFAGLNVEQVQGVVGNFASNPVGQAPSNGRGIV